MSFRDSVGAVLPLTAAQREIFFAEQRLGAPNSVYKVGEYVRIEGSVDRGLLEAATRDVIGQVDALHVRFTSDDAGDVGQVIERASGWSLPFIDFSSARDPLRSALDWMNDDVRRPMDLGRDPLFSYALLRLRTDCFIWYHGYHHIVMDAIGAQLIARRLAAVYTALAEGRPSDEQRFGSLRQLLADDTQYRSSERYRQDREFWMQSMGDRPRPTRLFAPSRTTPSSFERRTSWVPAESLDRMRAVTRRARVPVSQLAIAACAMYVHRMTGEDDVVLGLPVGARTSVISRATPCTASNILPLRISLSPTMSTMDLLQEVADRVADVAAHQGYRGEDLHRDLHGTGQLAAGYAPVINVMSFDYDLRFGAHGASVHNLSSGLVGDLAIAVWNRRDGRGLQVDFNAHPQVCTPPELAAHQDRFVALLDTFAQAGPQERLGGLTLLDPRERARALGVVAPSTTPAAGSGADAPPAHDHPTLVDLLEATAAGHRAATAVSFEGTNLSYDELDTRANRLAHLLIARGVGPEDVVAVAAPRAPQTLITLLATLKAGAAYLPLDPTYPPARLEHMMADARPAILLGDRSWLGSASGFDEVDALAVDDPATLVQLAAQPATSPTQAQRRSPLTGAHPAYVIYTSGSTGAPKGVLVTHHNVVRLFDSALQRFGLSDQDTWTLFHSPSFDFSVWEIWGALLHGGRLVVVPHDVSRTPAQFLRLLARERVTVLSQTPSAFYQLMEADRDDTITGDGLALRLVIFGGEALQPRRLAPWHARHGLDSPVLINMYGITETTVHVTEVALTEQAVSDEAASVIGTCLPHLRAYVLDPALQPLPAGGVGELYVAGDGLARGYLGQPHLSAQRFVADPFGPPGSRMYRSGDVASFDDGGELRYLGRSDHQVQMRGFRIELGEIETTLLTHPALSQATVLVRTDHADDARLVAYVVLSTDQSRPEGCAPPDLRAFLRERLPAHMVVASVVVLERLPLTHNGKLDRSALPAPTAQTEPRPGALRARTREEDIVCGLFTEVLHLPAVGPDDNFFELGGHSLLATRLSARLRTVFGIEMGLRSLFEAPTPAAIATQIDHAAAARPALVRYERPTPLPLSYAQRRLWFLHQLDEHPATYNIPFVLHLRGPLNRRALQAALDDVAARHESLRTLFPASDGVPHQVVLPTVTVPFEQSAGDGDAAATWRLDTARHRFDLTHEIPIRASLFTASPEDHTLLILVHHISADGWSVAPLARDLATAYDARTHGREPDFVALPAQYADYTLWQNDILGDPSDPGSLFAAQAGYWQQALAGLPECVTLPTDHPRPQVASHRGDYLRLTLDPALHADLLRLARENDVSLYMLFVASLAALMSGLGAGDDIPIGSPLAGRGDQALDELVGLFVNTQVLRVDTSGNPSFQHLLSRVRERALAADAHQDLPFEQLVNTLRPTRSLGHDPLFQVSLAVQNADDYAFCLPGLQVSTELGHTGTAKFDFYVDLTQQHDADGAPAGVRALLEYASDLFEPNTVRTFWDRWIRLLHEVALSPARPLSRIDLLQGDERRQVLADSAGPVHALGAHTLPELMRQRLSGRLDPVVLDADAQLSGGELDRLANQLAHLLAARGVRRGSTVALSMEHSMDAVVAIMAVLKAGAAYVPLDRRYPVSRIEAILHDTGACLVITAATQAVAGHGNIPQVPLRDLQVQAERARQPATDPDVACSSDDVAYVMYTSGSTGRPKGIAATHANVAALALDPLWRGGAHDRVLLHSPLAFDASTYELWVPLLGGGQVVVAPPGDLDVETLAATITDRAVTGVFLTSALFDVVAHHAPTCFAAVRQVWTGGEAVSPHAVTQVLTTCPDTVVVNVYGPTETTTFATWNPLAGPFTPAATVPIGRAMANHRTYVLGTGLQPVPTGVVGELYIAGPGLARGYLQQPAATAQRFVADPFGPTGMRMYRTGDLVRRTSAGALDFVGRVDDQIKLRGFRIEPGEIEAHLLQHPGVERVAVIARHDLGSEPRLVAYVVGDATPATLSSWIAQRLPAYMQPGAVVLLPDLPRTANGKLDRAALPAPDLGASAPAEARTPRERLICELFSQVLGLAVVSHGDDFFALGGDSISSIRLVSQARAAGLDVSVRDIFEQRTPAHLAQVLHEPRTDHAAQEDPRHLSGADGSGQSGDLALAGVEPTPIMCWLQARGDRMERFYQSMLLTAPTGLQYEHLHRGVGTVLRHHDVLRGRRIPRTDGDNQADGTSTRWYLEIGHIDEDAPASSLHVVEVAGLDPEQLRATVATHLDKAADRLSTTAGVLTQFVWFDAGGTQPGRLLILVHHLAVDGVSWHILVPDLVAAISGQPLARVATSFAEWSRHLARLATLAPVVQELPYWQDMLTADDPLMTCRALDPARDVSATAQALTVTLPPDVTEPLLTIVPTAFHANIQDVLLTALSLAVQQWRTTSGLAGEGILIDLEGHGRHEDSGLDLSRTVGWFTCMHPVRLDPGPHPWDDVTAGGAGVGAAIKRVKEQMRALPEQGRGFGLLRYLNPDTRGALADLTAPQIGFNYVGRFPAPGAAAVPGHDAWRIAGEADLVGGIDDAMPLAHGLEINSFVRDDRDGPRLSATWSWADGLWEESSVRTLAEQWIQAIRGLVHHGLEPGIGGHTPSDFPLLDLGQQDIERLEAMWGTQR